MASLVKAFTYSQNDLQNVKSILGGGSPKPISMVAMKSRSSTIKCSTTTATKGGQWLSAPLKEEQSERKAFDESMVGVKGLADKNLSKIPSFFIHESMVKENQSHNNNSNNMIPQVELPVIDLGFNGATDDVDFRAHIISKLREACETWGFFQLVNHGIPVDVMEKTIAGVAAFHEQDPEEKMKYYTRDSSKRVIFNSNNFLYNTAAATWKDTLVCKMAPAQPDWEDLPHICRDILNEYADHSLRVGRVLCELLSESLGLHKNYLRDIGSVDGLYFKGHYAPACPEPELTLGSVTHTDFGFLTLCLQSELGGLQVLFEDRYIEVPHIPGALIVNLGDMVQLVTNGKYRSVHHRAVAKRVGPRINLSAFLRPSHGKGFTDRKYEPIKELLSEENPAVYRAVTLNEYIDYYTNKGIEGYGSLSYFELEK